MLDCAAGLNWFDGLVESLNTLLGNLVPVLIALAVVVFFWGVVRYVTAGEDPEKRKNGRNLMIYGVIAIFVMVALWGLVALLGDLTGATPGEGAPNAPDLPT